MRALAVGLLVVLLTGCGSQPPAPPAGRTGTTPQRFERPPTREVTSGGGLNAAGLWVSSGNRYRDGTGPGILYGTITPPKGQPQFLYVGVFKYPANYSRFGTASGSGTTSAGDGNVTLVDGLLVNDQELPLRVALFVDAGTGKVTREEWQVAGEKVAPAKGRLVLMDFTKDKAAWKQVDVDLAKALAGVDPKDAGAMGTKGVAQLRKSTPAVDEFFK